MQDNYILLSKIFAYRSRNPAKLHPYKTMAPSFEAEEVKVFGAMYKKGYIYKGLKPVYWCYHDETALAEAEIEYQDDPCTTVYVKFPFSCWYRSKEGASTN